MFIIGIGGGTGSGKTTLANFLKSEFGESILVISYDSYYKSQNHIPESERANVNYDCPDALDTELLIHHLSELKNGKPINVPIYDFKSHTRSLKTIEVKPKKIVIVEGIMVFCDSSLRSMFDLKIFIDVDADIRILRRAKRDVIERGRDIDSIINQYLATVRPMYDLYVKPTKRLADIVVTDSNNKRALNLISCKIKSELFL